MSVITPLKKQPLIVHAPTFNVTVGVLGLLTVIGLASGVWRLVVGLGPTTTGLSDGYPWGIWIGFDFALIAFSGAGFTMASLVYIFRLERFRPALHPAILAGLLGYIAVLLLLALDLGRWDRFYHFIIYWNIHSPLFEISWCVLLYTIALLIEASPQLFERLNMQKPVRIVHRYVIPLVIIGLTLSSLHQSTLGTLYLNMPHRLHALWFTPILPLLFFASSIMAGLSLTMVTFRIATRIHSKLAQPGIMRGLATITAWVTLVYLVLKVDDILLAGEMPALFAFDGMSWLMWLELGGGAILPMILFFIPAVRNHRLGQWTGALLILAGVLLNRFNLTLFAQSPPAWATAPYSPHLVEWLSTIGILTGVTLAWYLGVHYLAIFGSTEKHSVLPGTALHE